MPLVAMCHWWPCGIGGHVPLVKRNVNQYHQKYTLKFYDLAAIKCNFLYFFGFF